MIDNYKTAKIYMCQIDVQNKNNNNNDNIY